MAFLSSSINGSATSLATATWLMLIHTCPELHILKKAIFLAASFKFASFLTIHQLPVSPPSSNATGVKLTLAISIICLATFGEPV